MKIQLAFQGGGARIALLLAAAEAVAELERDGEIAVTRIAGTSAGAIVGAFLAAKVPIPMIRANLASDHGAKLLRHFPAPRSKMAMLRALWRSIRGHALWDDAPLARWLHEQFAQAGLPQPQFESLAKDRKLMVVSTNLEAGRAEKHTRGDLITALLESAGLPFCFRSWASAGNTLNVDGGLCENFPVGDLLAHSPEDGPVLGFSFEEERPGRPGSFLAFAQALLSVSIGHSVTLAQSRLGADAVHQLTSAARISTFDFAQARAFLASPEYEQKKRAVREWIATLAAKRRIKTKADVWAQRESADLQKLMRKIGRVYRSQHEEEKFHYREVKLQVLANCLAERGEPGFGKPDEVCYQLALEPEGRPLFAHRLTLSSPLAGDFFGRYRVQLLNAQGARHPVEVIPSFAPSNTIHREVIVFFSPPLVPRAGCYRLSIVDFAHDLFASLRSTGTDYMSVELSRALEMIGPVQFGLSVPERLRHIRPLDNGTPGRRMHPGETIAAFGQSPLGFETIGWITEHPNPNKTVRVDYIHG